MKFCAEFLPLMCQLERQEERKKARKLPYYFEYLLLISTGDKVPGRKPQLELMQLNKWNALAVSMAAGDYAYKLWKLINAVVWYLDSYVCTHFLWFYETMSHTGSLFHCVLLPFCSLGFFPTGISSPALHSFILSQFFVESLWSCTSEPALNWIV